MTIVKDQHGRKLSLSTRRLTQLHKSYISGYIFLKDISSTGVPLYWRDDNQYEMSVGFYPDRYRIGCCIFSKTDFAKIMRAAKAAKAAQKARW